MISFLSSLVPEVIQVRDPGGVYLCTFLHNALQVGAPVKLALSYCYRAGVIPENRRLTSRTGSGRSAENILP